MKSPEALEHLPLHPVDFRILMALLDGPSYGTRIVQEIEHREGGWRKLYPANLYRRVRDLVSKELIEECSGPSDADPRRTYVCLSELGRAVASAEARRLRRLMADASRYGLLEQG